MQYKLGGLVLLEEGKSMNADGKAVSSTLATISFDTVARTYLIRVYYNGHYVDAKLSLLPHGFWWGFPEGSVRVVNTMQLTAKGEWKEATEVVVGGGPRGRAPRCSFIMCADGGWARCGRFVFSRRMRVGTMLRGCPGLLWTNERGFPAKVRSAATRQRLRSYREEPVKAGSRA